MTLPTSSLQIDIPVFNCLVTPGITRHTGLCSFSVSAILLFYMPLLLWLGFIAIEARSSVEVNEISIRDLLVADVADVIIHVRLFCV
jgi:hypothetical protein